VQVPVSQPAAERLLAQDRQRLRWGVRWATRTPPPAFTYVRPIEDEALMRLESLSLNYRMLFGYLTREGCRKGEAFRLRVRDFDLEAGTERLEQTKTGTSRSWALTPGVTRALATWVKQRDAQADDFMFTDDGGNVLTEGHRLAARWPARWWRRPAQAAPRRPEPAEAQAPRPSG
jgi:integrase